MARTSFRRHTQLLLPIALLITAPAVATAAEHATTLADTIAQSSAVVVASVSELDDRAGLKGTATDKARTKVTLHVEQVLHGANVASELELWFPVGVLPDGTIAGSTAVPRLTKGDRYIMFLRQAAGSLQIVKARDALLRIVSFPEKDVVVDQVGHGILASRQHGFLRLRKIAESLLGRFVARASETQPGLEYTSQAKLSIEDVQLATELPEVLAFIDDVARTGSPSGTTVTTDTEPGSVQLPASSTSGSDKLQAQ